MNGQAARRIRHAAVKSERPVRELKREYKRLPYHRRTIPIRGLRPLSHKKEEERYREFVICR